MPKIRYSAKENKRVGTHSYYAQALTDQQALNRRATARVRQTRFVGAGDPKKEHQQW